MDDVGRLIQQLEKARIAKFSGVADPERDKKDLRWLYSHCPAWGGHLKRGVGPEPHSKLFDYVANGYIRGTPDGYLLTQDGINYAFNGI